MDESTDIENKEPNRQKPPRSLAKIAGEILAGTATAATAAALAYLCLYTVAYAADIAGLGEGCMGGPVIWVIWGITCWVVPLAYGLAGAVAVYLVGSRRSQTGSFLATLGGSLLGLPVMGLLYSYIAAAEKYMTLGIEKIVLWPLVFLAVPIMGTIGFNWTRRYRDMAKMPGSVLCVSLTFWH